MAHRALTNKISDQLNIFKQPYSSVSNEMIQVQVTHVLGNNPWNINKKTFQIPSKKTDENEKKE